MCCKPFIGRVLKLFFEKYINIKFFSLDYSKKRFTFKRQIKLKPLLMP